MKKSTILIAVMLLEGCAATGYAVHNLVLMDSRDEIVVSRLTRKTQGGREVSDFRCMNGAPLVCTDRGSSRMSCRCPL